MAKIVVKYLCWVPIAGLAFELLYAWKYKDLYVLDKANESLYALNQYYHAFTISLIILLIIANLIA